MSRLFEFDDESDEQEEYDRPDEIVTLDDTPFTRTVRGRNRQMEHYVFKDAQRFLSELKDLGEADDGMFKNGCTIPPSSHNNQYSSETRYYLTVAPTLATADAVEWIGAMGVDTDAGPPPHKSTVRDRLMDMVGGLFDESVINVAAHTYANVLYPNAAEHGRRTQLRELKRPKWAGRDPHADKRETAYLRILPRLEGVDSPTDNNAPDWRYVGD